MFERYTEKARRTIFFAPSVPNHQRDYRCHGLLLRKPDSAHKADRLSLARSPNGWTKGSVRELTFL
jgi:hypothetical protein